MKIFNEKCDEIIITDISGSGPDFEFIEQIVSGVSPVCYGEDPFVVDIQK